MIHKLTTATPYTELFGPFDENDTSRHSFAAVNGAGGFRCYFDEIFGKSAVDRLYLLGGGPGSGKSTLLKKAAKRGMQRGEKVEQIHCSSSPFSLDGVLFPERRTALIDATPPHMVAPYAAGVREITVDLGRAWDIAALSERRDEIFALTDRKKREYRKAYLYLHAANLLKNEADSLTSSYILWEKLEKNLSSISEKSIPSGRFFVPETRIARSAGAAGSVYFETFRREAKFTYKITDYRGTGSLYFAGLFARAKKKNAHVFVSYAPETEGEIDGLFFPDSGVYFTAYGSSFDKNINGERFFDKKAGSEITQKLRFTYRSRASLLSEAYFSLAKAGLYHDRIEELYHPCTDFSITEEIGEKLLRQVFAK